MMSNSLIEMSLNTDEILLVSYPSSLDETHADPSSNTNHTIEYSGDGYQLLSSDDRLLYVNDRTISTTASRCNRNDDENQYSMCDKSSRQKDTVDSSLSILFNDASASVYDDCTSELDMSIYDGRMTMKYVKTCFSDIVPSNSFNIKSYSRKSTRYINKLKKVNIFRTKVERAVKILAHSQIEDYNMYANRLRGAFIVRNPIGSCLKYLDISRNELTYLCIDRVPNLEIIGARFNNLLNVNIKNNPRLKKIELENNKLTNVNNDLASNNALVKLYLGNNRISEFDSKCIPMSLKHLSLRENRLEILDLNAHQNIRTLDISYNKIYYINIDNTNLRSINASMNLLANIIPQSFFVRLPHLQEMILEGNPFTEYEENIKKEECCICLDVCELFRVYRYCGHKFCYSCSYKTYTCGMCRADVYANSYFTRTNNVTRPFSLIL